MPFSAKNTHISELHSDLLGNQGAPLFLSSAGRYLWSDDPFRCEFRDDGIFLTGSTGPVTCAEGLDDLPGAYSAAAEAHFPASGLQPPAEFFAAPQYNTWIELNHRQNQDDVLKYAKGIIENGYPPGVLMIDAGWFDYFGHLDFHAENFPAPREMVGRLKEWGFRVMLWVSPFFSADSREFRHWRNLPGWILRNRDGSPSVLEWWDGYSVHLDLTHPKAVEWFRGELRRLQDEYGIDGFKFDAGDAHHYIDRPQSWLNASPVELTERWAAFALSFPFNELRACWKQAGRPLVQRLQDRAPSWDERGLASLIPNAIAAGLIGHPFVCPDMVGGGEYTYFNDPSFEVDEELFVRSAQASALFPMMQFSCAPWRALSKEAADLCLAAVEIRQSLSRVFHDLAAEAARSGEPILRAMEFEFPNQGYAGVRDQFMLGSGILVAPALQKGAGGRKVALPPGRWRADDGRLYQGPDEAEIETPIERLPRFERIIE